MCGLVHACVGSSPMLLTSSLFSAFTAATVDLVSACDMVASCQCWLLIRPFCWLSLSLLRRQFNGLSILYQSVPFNFVVNLFLCLSCSSQKDLSLFHSVRVSQSISFTTSNWKSARLERNLDGFADPTLQGERRRGAATTVVSHADRVGTLPGASSTASELRLWRRVGRARRTAPSTTTFQAPFSQPHFAQ